MTGQPTTSKPTPAAPEPPEHALTCSSCHCSSTLVEEFTSGRVGFASKTWCPPCALERRRRNQRRTSWACIVLVMLGIIHMYFFPGSARSMDAFGVGFGVFFLSRFLMVLPHELGHALVGRAVGFRPLVIVAGEGKYLVDRLFFGVRVRLARRPTSGATYLALWPGAGVDWRRIALLAGGPLVNAVFAALALTYAFAIEPVGAARIGRVVLIGFGLANLLLVVENLWPRSAPTAGVGIVGDSDGAGIIDALKRLPVDLRERRAGLRFLRATLAYQDRSYERAAREALRARAYVDDPLFLLVIDALRAEALSESGRSGEALAALQPHLMRDGLSPGLRLHLDQAYVWAALLDGDPRLMEDALERVARCARLLPWDDVLAIKHASLLAATATAGNGRAADARRIVDGLGPRDLEGESVAYAAFARGLTAAAEGDLDAARRECAAARAQGATAAALQLLERRFANP